MQLSYLAIIVISLVLGLGTQWYINHTFKRWSKVDIGLARDGRAGRPPLPRQRGPRRRTDPPQRRRRPVGLLRPALERAVPVPLERAGPLRRERCRRVPRGRPRRPARARLRAGAHPHGARPRGEPGVAAVDGRAAARHLHQPDGARLPGHRPVRPRGPLPARHPARRVRRLGAGDALHLVGRAHQRRAGAGARARCSRPRRSRTWRPPSRRSCSCSTCCSRTATTSRGLPVAWNLTGTVSVRPRRALGGPRRRPDCRARPERSPRPSPAPRALSRP